MNVLLPHAGQLMPQQLFDRRILDTRLNQPRRRRMSEIVEVQVMHPRARTGLDPAMLETVRVGLLGEYWPDAWRRPLQKEIGERRERDIFGATLSWLPCVGMCSSFVVCFETALASRGSVAKGERAAHSVLFVSRDPVFDVYREDERSGTGGKILVLGRFSSASILSRICATA